MLMIMGLQTVRAEDVSLPADAMTTAQAVEMNSFFEPRTLEDFEQMIKRDTAASADLPADGSTNGGAG